LKVDILQNSCQSTTKFGSIRSVAIRHLFPAVGKLWSRGATIPWGATIPCPRPFQS